jgi:cell division protein FtsB
MKWSSQIQTIKQKYPILLNRYFLVVATFVLWITFFDRNSLISQYDEHQQLIQIKKTKLYYQKEIKSTLFDLNLLFSDNKKLEKFAREHYLMKKADEDIFVVVDQSKSSIN